MDRLQIESEATRLMPAGVVATCWRGQTLELTLDIEGRPLVIEVRNAGCQDPYLIAYEIGLARKVAIRTMEKMSSMGEQA